MIGIVSHGLHRFYLRQLKEYCQKYKLKGDNNMTLKMKLTSLIASFTLVIGLMLIGIMAVNQATVNMGGSINFTATDVYARVTGKIENAQGEYADKELPPLEFSAENGTPDQSEWSGLNLLFDDDATPIVITVKVENLAKDRKLTASLTDNTAINENLVKDLKQDGVTYTSGTTKDLDASTGEGTSTTTYVVTFSIADHNKSLPQMDFELDIDLMDEGYEPPLEILEGFVFDNGVLTAYNGIATDVVIPNSYSIGYTEDEEMERNFSLDIVPDLAQTLTEMAIFSNWNYTDASGKSGVITYADMMGSGEDLQSLVFPLQVELDYKVTYSEYSETNLQMIQTFMTSFEELTSQGYISGGFYATVGENAKIYYANTADFDVDYPDLTSVFPIALELENPISIEMYKNIKSFTFDPNAESDPNVLADLEMYSAMLPISTWNYTDAKGDKGTLTMADFMGLTDNVTPISYPIDIEVTYNTTIPTATDENLELCMQLFSNYMQAFEEMKSTRYITGGFYATVNGQPRTLFNSTEEFVNFLMENFEGIENDDTIFKEVFPMIFELENPVIIPGGQVFVEGNDIEVTGITDGIFRNNSHITSVVLPDCVTTISNSMFGNCTNLQSVTIPKNVTSIENAAFSNCRALTEINYNAVSVADLSSNNNVFNYAGQNGAGIVVNFGEGVKHIPANLFNPYYSDTFSPNIVKVNLSSTIISIGYWAFYRCNGFTSITLPSSLESIGNQAFGGCYSLVEIFNYSQNIIVEKGDDSNGDVGAYAKVVYNASDLIGGKPVSRIQIRDKVQYYVYGRDFIALAPAVARKSLTTLTLDSNTTEINQHAFDGCSGLTGDLIIPEGVTSIGSSAFLGCSGFTSITIPSSLTNIEGSAFHDMSGLTNINYNAIWVDDTNFDNSMNLFNNAGENSGGITVVFGEGVRHIPSRLFYNATNQREEPNIRTVKFPSTIESIGGMAFYESPVTSINFNNCTNLKSIGGSAFYNCNRLTGELNLSNCTSLTSIGGSAFENCIGLTGTLNLSNCTNLVSIDSRAFYNCSKLTGKIDFNNCTNLKEIGNSAFYSCYGLTGGLDFSNCINLISIGDSAFYSCGGLTGELGLGNCINLESIGDSAFYGCDGLTGELVIPEGIIRIANSAFYSCRGLTSVTLPSGLTSIGSEAFRYCSGLKEINLSDCTSLITIETNAFFICTELISVAINQFIFENVTSTSSSYGYILCYIDKSGETVLVPANLIDDLHLTNSYLDDTSEFTRSETANEDGYYVYTKK